MSIQQRIQDLFDKFNVNLTVTENTTPRVDLAEATLDNGTVVYTDDEAFNEGSEVYIINDEGERIALPQGDYELQDGGVLSIGEGGKIVSSSPAESDDSEEINQSENENMNYVSKEEVEEMIASAIQKMKEELEHTPEHKEDEDKEEMSEVNPEAKNDDAIEAKVAEPEVVEEKVEEEESVELSAVLAELSETRAQLTELQKQAASAGLKRATPQPQAKEPLSLASMTTEERIKALAKHYTA